MPQAKTENETKFEYLVIPTKMRRRSADLSYLDSYLKPGQDLVNLFTKEFDIDEKKDHPYIPFVVPELRKKPRSAPISVTRTSKQGLEGYRFN